MLFITNLRINNNNYYILLWSMHPGIRSIKLSLIIAHAIIEPNINHECLLLWHCVIIKRDLPANLSTSFNNSLISHSSYYRNSILIPDNTSISLEVQQCHANHYNNIIQSCRYSHIAIIIAMCVLIIIWL